MNPKDDSGLPDDVIRFEFHLINKSDIPEAFGQDVGHELLVSWPLRDQSGGYFSGAVFIR